MFKLEVSDRVSSTFVHVNIYTSSIFLYYVQKNKIIYSFFYETVPVTYESAAVPNTALLCIKNWYFIVKIGEIRQSINVRIEFYLFVSHSVMENRIQVLMLEKHSAHYEMYTSRTLCLSYHYEKQKADLNP